MTTNYSRGGSATLGRVLPALVCAICPLLVLAAETIETPDYTLYEAAFQRIAMYKKTRQERRASGRPRQHMGYLHQNVTTYLTYAEGVKLHILAHDCLLRVAGFNRIAEPLLQAIADDRRNKKSMDRTEGPSGRRFA